MADQAGGNYQWHTACRPMHGIWEQIIPVYLRYLHGTDHLDGHNIWGLEDLLHYMDNTFGYEYDHKLIFYEPHNDHFSLKQAALLTLWDDIGLPHKRQKQIQTHNRNNWLLGGPKRHDYHNVSQLKIQSYHSCVEFHWQYQVPYSFFGQVAMDPGLDQLGFKHIPTPTSSSAIMIWENCGEIMAISTNVSQLMHHMRPHLACETYAGSQMHLHAQFNHVGSHKNQSYHFLWCMPKRAQLLLPISEHQFLLTDSRHLDEHNLFSQSNLCHFSTSMGGLELFIGTLLLTHLHRLNGHSWTVPCYVMQCYIP